MSPKPFKCDEDTARRIETRLGFHLMHVDRIISPPTPKYKLLVARFRKLKDTGYSFFTPPGRRAEPHDLEPYGYRTERLSTKSLIEKVIKAKKLASDVRSATVKSSLPQKQLQKQVSPSMSGQTIPIGSQRKREKAPQRPSRTSALKEPQEQQRPAGVSHTSLFLYPHPSTRTDAHTHLLHMLSPPAHNTYAFTARELITDDGPLPRSGDGASTRLSLPERRPIRHRPPGEDTTFRLIKERKNIPISQEQLVAEVKGIYAGLIMVETNIPAPALRRLATKYAMPARMWRHGIHSFLELLRHRLPASREHMLTFIYLAYSMMTLLYETVPAFEDTWIDDKWPTTGRLYHHLAVLARPTGFQQLFYYTKSLLVAIQFDSARESVMTLLDPIMAPGPNQVPRFSKTEYEFIRCHGIIFSKKFLEKFEESADNFIDSLDNFIASRARHFIQPGYWVGMIACCAIAGYGNERHPFFEAIRNPLSERQGEQPLEELDVPKETTDAITLANRTHTVIFQRYGDDNILPYIHVTLVFMYRLTFIPEVNNLVAREFPWKLLALMLNYLVYSDSVENFERIEGEAFPEELEKGDFRRPLPEDYAMRGLLWTDDYFPRGHFDREQHDDDEKYRELPSMAQTRKERVLFLSCRIAARKPWLRYDRVGRRFSAVTTETDADLEHLPDAV
ncbi:hypothetical protein GE09DRAFT_1273977 [Coniochaeta sp. 2T2.1]|nr:hypothetical protein GE09DRAFT_1273977 [Coniochaeta sp. 2T2.1]